jgi:hypothetical protein
MHQLQIRERVKFFETFTTAKSKRTLPEQRAVQKQQYSNLFQVLLFIKELYNSST